MKMVAEGEECALFEMCEAPGVCQFGADGETSTCVACPLVCPPCHIPNDDCSACVVNPDEDDCDPCGFDANGQNGHALCALLTGDPTYKCCSPTSDCTKADDGAIDTRLPSTVTWNPSTLICSQLCADSLTTDTCLSGPVCTVGEPIVLPFDDLPATVDEVPTCSC